MKPLTVYILTYNRSNYLEKCINSVLKQSYSNFDLYILDNCSTDDTSEIVKKISDKRINYLRHEKNIGFINNTNFAFNHCQTDYLVIFHDDDIMKSDFLRKELKILEDNLNIDAVCCLSDNIDCNDNIIEVNYNANLKSGMYESNEIINYFMHTQSSCIQCPSVMYRKDSVKKYNIQFKKEAGLACDAVAFMDLERAGGHVFHLSEKLICYRYHAKQESSIHKTQMHMQLIKYLLVDEYYRNKIFSFKKNHILSLLNCIYVDCLFRNYKLIYIFSNIGEVIKVFELTQIYKYNIMLTCFLLYIFGPIIIFLHRLRNGTLNKYNE